MSSNANICNRSSSVFPAGVNIQSSTSSLHRQAFRPITTDQLEETATAMERRTGYPRAVGSLDETAGSEYFNYKGYHSVVFLAICDAWHRLIAYDIGASGRSCGAGVFRASKLKEFLLANDTFGRWTSATSFPC